MPVTDRAALIAVVFPVSGGPRQTTIGHPAYTFVKVLLCSAIMPPAITSRELMRAILLRDSRRTIGVVESGMLTFGSPLSDEGHFQFHP